MSEIILDGLSKEYGDVIAVSEVDLEVKNGEFIAILGPSGSGKTTILTMIAGFETPTRGRIKIGNIDVTNQPSHKRNVGLVFQNYALFPHLTVFQNVAFPLTVRKVPKDEIEIRVKKALELVRLENYAKRKPNELSGGQQQRVALARSYVFEPSILLLDEPLAALDRKLRQDVQVEIRKLQRSLGITTITVTHDQEEAMTMSDRMLILRDGKIEQMGSPKELYSKPKTRFVAEFLGTANLLEGKINMLNERALLILANGAQIPIDEIYKAQVSENAWLMLRPEQIKITSGNSTEGYRGTVVSAIYVGDEYRYHIESEFGQEIIVKEVGSNRKWDYGEQIKFSWNESEHWLVID
ncbi:ABC transporter ATP-binding protein [Sporosarcina sp. 179-K 3D1 HS]|uniref:ABC transporter ATP-binding protein n=1 Tax=Sporosarcina sp. 179-K 3D1 HS TaxID=3232169 RepID=UPI0039A2B7C1